MPVNETVERIVYDGVDRLSPANKTAADSTKVLRQHLDETKNAIAALGVTIGAGAMIALYKDTLAAVSALDDMAESTGASVEGLSAIQRVAKVGGHDFEGLTGQISRMVKGLRDGTEEGNKTAQAFAFLDVKARDADGRFRDTGEILVELAKKLETVSSTADRNLLVQDALGKGAERYIPLLKEIAEGTDLHATVTAKQAQQAEEAEKNIRRLTLAFEDSRRELVNQYTPALVRFTDELVALSRAPGNFFANFFSVSGRQADDPVRALAEVESRLQKLRADAEVLGGNSLGAKFNRMMAPEDLAILYRQIEHAERQRGVLQQLVARRNRAAASDSESQLFEFAGGGIDGRSYNPAAVGFTAEEIERRQRAVVEAAIRARNSGAFDEAQRQLNPFYLSPEEQEKAGADWVRSIIEMKRDVEAKISRFQLAPTMDDDAINPEGDARLRAFLDSLKLEEDLEVEAHRRRMAQFEEFTADSLAAYGGRAALIEGLNEVHQARMLDIERRKHQAQRGMEMTTVSLAAGLLQQFAGKSKAAALAVIAINRGLMVAQTIQSTAAAVMRAYAELGPIAGSGAAAYIKTLGAIQIGLISAAGLVEASNLGGGGGATPTFAVNPNTGVPLDTSTQTNTAAQQPPQQITTVIDMPAGRRIFTLEDIEDLFELMNEHARNGGRLDRVILRRS